MKRPAGVVDAKMPMKVRKAIANAAKRRIWGKTPAKHTESEEKLAETDASVVVIESDVEPSAPDVEPDVDDRSVYKIAKARDPAKNTLFRLTSSVPGGKSTHILQITQSAAGSEQMAYQVCVFLKLMMENSASVEEVKIAKAVLLSGDEFAFKGYKVSLDTFQKAIENGMGGKPA